jgi:hypothetical protein
MRQALHSQHHFTTAYTPWANGTVERACRDVLRASRALLSEFRLRSDQWPEVAPIVQLVLNNSPSPQRGNIAPLTAFTGREPDSPLRSLVFTVADATLSLDMIRAQQLVHIEALRSTIDNLHHQARESAQANRASARASHANSRATAANFEIGDFVLVAKREFQGGEKLCLKWQGPFRIVGTRSDFVFDVEDLNKKLITSIHSTRLRFYHDSSLDVTTDILAHVAHQNLGYEVRALRDLSYNSEEKAFYALVSWLGFEEADSTWEPLLVLHEDIPKDVTTFLQDFPDRSLAAQARAVLP